MIREAINELGIVVKEEIRLSASIGIATRNSDLPLASEGELLAAADAALYIAKGAGKNRSHSVSC